MSQNEFARGHAELRAARAGQIRLFWAVGVFSVLVNMLMLTGPLYMLQVYDRVLGSRSEATLVALSLLVTFLFLAMGLLDHARSRIMARIGAAMQDRLDHRVFAAAMKRLALAPTDPVGLAAQRDLEAVQRLWASPVLMSIFDIPFTPFFVAAIFVFHPLLGWLAVSGGVFLIVVTVLNQRLTQTPINRTNGLALQAERMSDLIKTEAEAVQALGMTGAAFQRWQKARGAALAEGLKAGDLGGRFGSVSKTFRIFLQSAMLGLGAWLVLKGELSSGAMIAGSILMGRALQPIEQAVGQWALVTRAQEGTARLAELLSRVPPEPPRTALPRPRAILDVQSLSVVPPGETQAVLRGVTFQLGEGQALGIIGPSGAGKSTLARAIIGVWRPAAGKIRLDGAALDQYDPDVLGSYIGYLPQRVTLFEGTIAENIARLHPKADSAKIVEAAQKAAAHDMILRLPEGYDTRVSTLGGRLSGGQIQRIGLARALYDNPVMLVLDEPNSNLDNDGTMALNIAIRSIKAAGGSVIIMAHRPAAIQECDLLLVVEEGMRRAFGPRDQVLKEMVKNHTDIVRSAGPGGGVMSLLRKKTDDGTTAPLPAKPGSDAPPRPPTEAEVARLLSARTSVLVGSITAAVLVFGFGLWSVLTEISGAIVASGQLEVSQNRQVVQHPDGGVVAEIAVKEAQSVKAGDLLIRLDGALVKSELAIVEGQLFEVMARSARLEAERDDAAAPVFSGEIAELAKTDPEVADLIEGQRSLFIARRDTVLKQSEQLQKRSAQITAQIEGVDAQVKSLSEQLALIEQELKDQRTLLEKGLAQSSRVLALEREASRLQGSVGELQSSRAQAEGRATEVELEVLRLAAVRREDANTQLRDIGAKMLELAERRRALTEQISRLEIRAPVSGTVLGLAVTTPRSVIRPADPLLYLIPQDRPLVINAQVQTIHVDEVHVGQKVRLMFPAFSARTTPETFGHVVSISADALLDERAHTAFYKAEIVLDAGELDRLQGLTLVPGMPVEAFIETGARSPMAYLLKPFTDYFSVAFRES